MVLRSQVSLHQSWAPRLAGQTSSDSQSPLKSHPGDLYEKVVIVASRGVLSEYKEPGSSGFLWIESHLFGTPGSAGSFTGAAGALGVQRLKLRKSSHLS